MEKWISVEKLPKEDCMCLVHNENHSYVYRAVYNEDIKEFTLSDDLNPPRSMVFLSVTHYIVIPTIPFLTNQI